jgi:hypothetical protein
MAEQEMYFFFSENDKEGKPVQKNFSEKVLEIYKNPHSSFVICLHKGDENQDELIM